MDIKNIDNILDRPAFSCLEAEQKNALRTLIPRLKDKSASESMPLIISFVQTMPKGRTFTVEEKIEMINVMMEVLPENDKTAFKNLITFLNIDLK